MLGILKKAFKHTYLFCQKINYQGAFTVPDFKSILQVASRILMPH
jgi:hypothetical protein